MAVILRHFTEVDSSWANYVTVVEVIPHRLRPSFFYYFTFTIELKQSVVDKVIMAAKAEGGHSHQWNG